MYDYEALKKDPKIIIGYSDVTAILLAIYAKTGINTYYGPAIVSSFGELPPFIADFDSCHTHPMITIPLGSIIELNSTEQKISII